jgi:quinol monooxygenase YgiN
MHKRTAKRRLAKTKSRSRRAHSDVTGKLAKAPKSGVTLIVILRAKDGQELLLGAELRALIHPTRKENGCLRYDLYKSASQPNDFLLHEVWATREHHRLHTQTPHFLRWDARKDALLASREATFWQPLA